MNQLKFPIGLQSFRKLRENECYYVDKTEKIERLLGDGYHFFLSRPRRFGKSLLLSTLKELFEGNEVLFEGLYIFDRWDWSKKHPVVYLSFGAGHFYTESGLQASVADQFSHIENEYGIAIGGEKSAAERFGSILRQLQHLTGQSVVVLIDEYDKPILDALHIPEIARTNRDFLRGLFSVIKHYDEYIRLSFITGVSKFTKVSLFSGLNNLKDITLVPKYSTLCGYTEHDLDAVFGSELAGLDRKRIREWYNGYSWRGEEKVYNPFDILLLLDSREFKAHWFETGTPRFLLETLVRKELSSYELDGITTPEERLSTFDVEEIAPEALLFQTGYLTILEEEPDEDGMCFRLGFPNREVRQGLNRSLASYLVNSRTSGSSNIRKLRQQMREADTREMQKLLHALYASIPNECYRSNDIANYEGFYASVFYSHFAALGPAITVENSTNIGRLDMALRCEDYVYIFEFKVIEQAGAGTALAQLQDKQYANKYRSQASRIFLVAVEFSSESRNIVSFDALET